MLHPENHHQNRIAFLKMPVVKDLPSETVWKDRQSDPQIR